MRRGKKEPYYGILQLTRDPPFPGPVAAPLEVVAFPFALLALLPSGNHFTVCSRGPSSRKRKKNILDTYEEGKPWVLGGAGKGSNLEHIQKDLPQFGPGFFVTR